MLKEVGIQPRATWFYKEKDDTWKEFSHPVTLKLEDVFQKFGKNSKITINFLGQNCEVDFGTMTIKGQIVRSINRTPLQTKKVFTQVSYPTSTTITFLIPNKEGEELHPGEELLFKIPDQYHYHQVGSVILGHRKAEKYRSSIQTVPGPKKYFDKEGAYVRVAAHHTETQKWVPWEAKKFAEPRSASNPEEENLHDWQFLHGQRTVVKTDLISVKNACPDCQRNAVANVHYLKVIFFQRQPCVKFWETIFTPGTQFSPLLNGYPTDRPRFRCTSMLLSHDEIKKFGLYPQAIKIGPGAQANDTLGPFCFVDSQGRFIIKLKPNVKIGLVEIAVGDTKLDPNKPLDQQVNKDGHIGKLGGSKLCIQLNYDGEYWMNCFNVPPFGVLFAGPVKEDYVTQNNDILVISAKYDPAWLMGYRILLI